MRTLVIDDDALTLTAVSEKLKAEGHVVFTAGSGSKALNVLNNENIELIICDVLMPGVSALSLLSILNNKKMGKIPLILMSSLNSAETISKSLGLEISAFFPKPIDYKRLFSLVKNMGTA